MLNKRFKGINNTVEAFELRKVCGCDPLCNCGCQTVTYSTKKSTTLNSDYWAYSKVYAR